MAERTQDLSKANKELKLHSIELERSNRELKSFAAIVSHDLQEPLRKITIFSDQLLSKSSNISEQDKDHLTRIRSAVTRMQAMIDDLLQLASIQRSEQTFMTVDLNAVVREVLEDLETSISEAQARVEVDSLPILEANPSQMRQLFQNLISNAIKYQEDGKTPVVQLTSSLTAGKTWEIRVEDNGIGFDEKYAERIFLPMKRLQGRNYEGTGLGLAICEKIVAYHHGTITAKSEINKGSTFVITLPENPRI